MTLGLTANEQMSASQQPMHSSGPFSSSATNIAMQGTSSGAYHSSSVIRRSSNGDHQNAVSRNRSNHGNHVGRQGNGSGTNISHGKPKSRQFSTSLHSGSRGPNMKRRHTFEVHTDSDLHSKLLSYKMSPSSSENNLDPIEVDQDSYHEEDEDDDHTSTPMSQNGDDPSTAFSFLKRHSSSNSIGSRYESDEDEFSSSTPHSFNFNRRAFSFSVHPSSKRSYVDIDSNESDAIRRRYSISHDRRRGISSEIIDMAALSKHKPPVNPKSDDERSRLSQSTQNNVLFRYLETDDKKVVYDAMFEKKYKAGESIITQGADGDNFYVVDTGECEIFQKEGDNEEKLVKTATAGDSFGELALIYGQPRAATVRAKTDVKCWAIDRLTFRKIMMGTTLKKRRLYEEFLKKVTVLENLTPYERLTVSDALVPCEYKDGDVIIKEGGQAYSFYIITDGEVKVTKRLNGEIKEVARLQKSNYFGELALLFDQPRAATVIAVGDVKCIKMDRKSFNSLLGPCVSILKRNLERYNEFMTQKMI